MKKEKETVFENEEPLTDLDTGEIGRLIQEGCTSGLCDSSDYRIAWELRWNKWQD